MFTQKGGIKIRDIYTSETAFKFFIDNAVTEVLTWKTKGGILFKSKLKAGIVSPYISSRSNDPEKDIQYILFKLCLLNHKSEPFVVKSRTDSNSAIIELNGTTNSEFISEIKTQLDVFNKSMDQYLEPICPSVVYTQICRSYNEKKKLLNLFIDPQYVAPVFPAQPAQPARSVKPSVIEGLSQTKVNNMKYIFEDVLDKDIFRSQFKSERMNRDKTPQWFQYGIVVMEFLQDFLPVKDFIQDTSARKPTDSDKKFYKQLTMYEIWRLYNIGYMHGDIHLENAMLHRNYKYIKGRDGRVIIIDFGATFPITQIPGRRPPINLNPTNPREMEQIINIVYNTTTPRFADYYGGTFQNKTWHSYQWLASRDPTSRVRFSTNLLPLHISREALKREFLQHQQTLSAQNVVPLVPVVGNFFQLPAQIGGVNMTSKLENPTLNFTYYIKKPKKVDKDKYNNSKKIYPNYNQWKNKNKKLYSRFDSKNTFPNLKTSNSISSSIQPEVVNPNTSTNAMSVAISSAIAASVNIFDILDPTGIFTQQYVNQFVIDIKAMNNLNIGQIDQQLSQNSPVDDTVKNLDSNIGPDDTTIPDIPIRDPTDPGNPTDPIVTILEDPTIPVIDNLTGKRKQKLGDIDTRTARYKSGGNNKTTRKNRKNRKKCVL